MTKQRKLRAKMEPDENPALRHPTMFSDHIKTITLKQKGIKALQRAIKNHKDELQVHADHLSDMHDEIGTLLMDVERAIGHLDKSRKALTGED